MKRIALNLLPCFLFVLVRQPAGWPDGDSELPVREFLSGITQPTRLIQEAAQACWSPDGLRIAYSNMPGGEDRMNGGGIMILAPGEKKSRRLTADGKDPAWSPDGQWIAYVRAGYEDTLESIWLVRSEGTSLPQFIAEGGYPQWKPDSRTLVYHSRQTNRVCQVTLENGNPIHKEKLFDLPYWYPRLSPDGKEIAYLLPSLKTYYQKNDPNQREYALIVSDLKKNLHYFKTVPFNAFMGKWSPDGDWIVFGGFIDRSFGLKKIKADLSSPPESLLEENGSRPDWSPDGQYLAFDQVVDGKLELWVMRYSQ